MVDFGKMKKLEKLYVLKICIGKSEIPIRLKSLEFRQRGRLARILLLIYTKGNSFNLKENNKLENVRSSLLFPWKSFHRK